MNTKSMRVRLPLTYAAIALLTALALGGVLIFTLRDYYTHRERLYLRERAATIQPILNKMMETRLPPEALEAQVKSLAFFTQARLRFLDAEGRVLADSGDPTQSDVFSVLPLSSSVDLEGGSVGIIQSLNAPPPAGVGPGTSESWLETQSAPANPPEIRQDLTAPFTGTLETNSLFFFRSDQGESEARVAAPPAGTVVMLSAVPRTVAFGSFDLFARGQDSVQRSSQVVRLPVRNSSVDISATLVLSEGPAFGGAILESVIRATLAAGLVAVLLAALVGWFASRQVTGPLTALTQVTRQMAAGDLSARADVLARDEFGTLGESFNRMAGRVEETVSALRKFASDAAHEIKTPLTALATDLELAREAELTSQEREDLVQRAQGQVQRLERLMDNLLDLSRLEAGWQDGPPLPVDLAGLLQDAGENFASQAEQRELDFDLQLPPAPLIVTGYPEQLRRAVANLLDNAVKFTMPGGSVQLRLEVLEGEAEICISDTGIGLLPEDLAQVFQRFHRGRNAAAYSGSGLGLAIVQAIVQAHGGRVWAENNPEGGARFTIRLPLAKDSIDTDGN